MDANAVYQKTGKGDDEIRTRAGKLDQKLRNILILVDGTKTAGQLQAVAARLGMTQDVIGQLATLGLIAPAGGAARPAAAPAGGPLPGDEVARFMAAQKFMNDTVVNALGMRGFFLTLKIEKCSSRAELTGLLDDYGKAIAKGSGNEAAAVLAERARELLS